MPDPLNFRPPDFPSLAGYLAPRFDMPPLPADIPATGQGNWLTSGFMAGVHGAVSEGARALQAGAQFLGAPGAAQSFSDYAEAARAREQSYARSDLEEHPWSLPGIGYNIARMVPMGAAAAGIGLLGAATAPEAAAGAGAAAVAAAARTAAMRGLAGSSLAMYPTSAGANVQRQITETGELTTPGKALAWGVPEAVVQGWLPGRLEKYFGEGILRGIGHAAATQGFAGGATEWMTQKLGDPDREFADRASAIGSQALSGAALGGIVGGAFGGIRALAGKPARDVLNDPKAMANATDQALAPPQPKPAPEPVQLPLPLPRVPEGLQDLPLFARRSEEAPTTAAEPVVSAVPTPVADTIRFYHGGEDPTSGGPRWVTPSEDYARNFRAPEGGNEVHYVDIPRSRLQGGDLGAGYDEISNYYRHFEAPEDIARQLKPVEKLAAPVVPAEPAPVTAPTTEAPAPAEPPPVAAPAPVLNFTARLTEKAFKEGMAEVAAAPPEAQAAVKQQLIDLLVERGDKKPTVGLKKWGRAFDILTPEGELRDEFIPDQPLEAPPGVTEEAPVAPGERLTYASAGAVRRRPLSFEAGRAGEPAAPEAPGIERLRSAYDALVASNPNRISTVDISALAKKAEMPIEQVHKIIGDAVDAGQASLGRRSQGLAKVPPDVIAGAIERQGEKGPETYHTVTFKPVDDRAAVLNEVQAQIGKIADPEVKYQRTVEAEAIAKLLPRVEGNPGLADVIDKKVDNLRNAVEAATQPPADQVASPDLAPSPRAEVAPAPSGDLDVRLTGAQQSLVTLRKALGDRKDAIAALDQHEQWLKTVQDATGPEELRNALAADPEIDPEADNLGNLTQLSKPMQAKIGAYLARQQAVLQELRYQSGPESRARVISSRDGLPVTQLDADVTDMHQRGVPLADVADHIIEHTADPEQAEIVARLKAFLPEDAKTVFRDGVTDKEGEYFTKQKISALYNAANATTTSIHEMAHAVMHRALEGDSVAAKAIHGIYDQLKDKGDHAGLTDAHEMVSEAMANPVYRDFLKSQIVKGTSLWDRFVDTMRSVIGLPPRLFNAFDRIMSHGDDLMKEQKQYPNDAWVGPNSYARQTDNGIENASNAADEGELSIRQKISEGVLPVKSFMRGVGLGWNNGYWLARDPTYNKLSPSIPEFVDALKKEDPRRAQIGRLGVVADRQARALPAEGQELLKQVMAASTSYGFHPDRSLADYPDIHGDQSQLQKFGVVKDLWNQLGKIPGGQEAYNTWRSTMSALGHMSAIQNLQATERTIPGLGAIDTFNKLANLGNDPKKMDAFVQNELIDKIKAGTAFRDQLSAQKTTIDTGLAAQLKKDQPKEFVKQSSDLGSQVDRLSDALKEATSKQDRMLKEPYFHLGRQGNFFVTGKLVTAPGEVDPETGKARAQVDQDILSKFADHLEKNKINDVAIMQGNQHDTFYARVKNPSEMAALARILGDAQKKGLLSAEPIARGEILDPKIFNRVSSEGMQDIIEQLRANRPVAPEGASEETVAALRASHGAQIADLQRTLLSMTPETSMSRLMARRQNVQGFNKDMLQSQAFAADIASFSLARQSLMPEVRAAEAGMLKDVEAANRDPNLKNENTRLGLSDVVAELMRQQRVRQTIVPETPAEAARQFTNFLHIGMSPSYVAMQLGQLGVTGLPELAKTHGFGSGMAALARALSPAMQVVKAVAQSADRLTGTITREALEKAGLQPSLVNTVEGMVLRGSLGTYTAQVAEHSPTWAQGVKGTAWKVANVLGLYADLVPRLVMGLAADQLYKAKPYSKMTLEQFTDHVMNESQGYWGSALGARQTSRAGMLGAATPIVTQFSQWNIHMTNKLYHEVYDLFDKDTRPEAARWLAGHAAAVTMLSGTLGLPVLSVAASVYDKLADLFTNRDDHDITASYRNFLASTFGKDMGEIIARGLPRSAGVDFANWGEGEIVPGSSSLNVFLEKRKLEDMERDWLKSLAGPAPDQMFQLIQGARDITNGDYLGGLSRMMPGAIKGPLEAYELGQHGFVNSQTGQQLPITANGYDIALKALGIKSAKQAEYQEVAKEAAGLRAMREASSANISQHLQKAYMEGDQAGLRTWMGEAQRWQVDHPGLMPPQASFGRALQTHMRATAQARGLGLPIGVTPQDVGARGALRYGNIPVQ